MHIVVILALIPVDISGSEVKPTMPSVLHILRGSILSVRCFICLIHTRICVIDILAHIPIDNCGSLREPLEVSCG
jgi:hypothetical protein